MSAKRHSSKRLRSVEGDRGGRRNPPWQSGRSEFADRDAGRKARQLCSQVADTLNYVLAGECDDEVLQNLCVLAVDPAPNTSRLLVTVSLCVPDPTVDVAQVLERLARATGMLRCEVAAGINRRRTPQLLFQMAGPAENG